MTPWLAVHQQDEHVRSCKRNIFTLQFTASALPPATQVTCDHEREEPEAAIGGAESHHEVHHRGEDDGAKRLRSASNTSQPAMGMVKMVEKTGVA